MSARKKVYESSRVRILKRIERAGDASSGQIAAWLEMSLEDVTDTLEVMYREKLVEILPLSLTWTCTSKGLLELD